MVIVTAEDFGVFAYNSDSGSEQSTDGDVHIGRSRASRSARDGRPTSPGRPGAADPRKLQLHPVRRDGDGGGGRARPDADRLRQDVCRLRAGTHAAAGGSQRRGRAAQRGADAASGERVELGAGARRGTVAARGLARVGRPADARARLRGGTRRRVREDG